MTPSKGLTRCTSSTHTRTRALLGEVKFYKNIGAAIRDVVKELEEHMEQDYLRQEFALIANKIEDDWAGSDELKDLYIVIAH